MTSLANQPTNTNQLTQDVARMMLMRAPTFNFFSQEISLPGLAIGEATHWTGRDRVPWPGDVLRREDLEVTFRVDEDLANYMEIWNWMVALAAPDSADQYADLNAQATGRGIFSDINVLVYNSARRPNIEFRFQDAFPVGLSALRFTTKNGTVMPMDASVGFRYRHYTVHASADGAAL